MTRADDIRSWCHPIKPSFGEAAQRDRLTGEIYLFDRRRDQRKAMIQSIRPGSVIEVVELFLLAKPDGGTAARRRDLVAAVDKIEAAGGRIRELSTGDETPGAKSRMLLRAYEMLGRAGRSLRSAVNGAKSSGRPRKDFTPEQMAAMEQIWHSRRYSTRKDAFAAIEALGFKVRRGWLYARFGKPGEGVEPIEAEKLGAPPKEAKTWVYFIRDGDKVKIGYSGDPRRRMNNIKTHSPLELLAVIPGGTEREAKLHKRFSAHRIPGAKEWFHFVPEIEQYIARYGRQL